MKYEEIIQAIKQKDYKPVYFLHGEESYYIDLIAKYIEENVLNEAEKGFNLITLYGKEVDFKNVVDNARRYPMMAQYQVVFLKEAQEMRTLSDLQSYVEQPSPSTLLVICHKHKRLKFNTKFGKAVKKNAVVFEAKKLYDNQIPSWINDYLSQKGLSIDGSASALVAEYLGTDLSKISNELDKLVLNVSKGTKISTTHIQDNIGISKDYNVFELQEALGNKNQQKAQRIVFHFAANEKKNPFPLVVGTLYNFFSKTFATHQFKQLNDLDLAKGLGFYPKNAYAATYQVKKYRSAMKNYPISKLHQIFTLLRVYDLKSKGLNFDTTGKESGALLKELIYKILN